jgi:polyferredoxin
VLYLNTERKLRDGFEGWPGTILGFSIFTIMFLTFLLLLVGVLPYEAWCHHKCGGSGY